jgi:hypothetical protein
MKIKPKNLDVNISSRQQKQKEHSKEEIKEKTFIFKYWYTTNTREAMKLTGRTPIVNDKQRNQ